MRESRERHRRPWLPCSRRYPRIGQLGQVRGYVRAQVESTISLSRARNNIWEKTGTLLIFKEKAKLGHLQFFFKFLSSRLFREIILSLIARQVYRKIRYSRFIILVVSFIYAFTRINAK